MRVSIKRQIKTCRIKAAETAIPVGAAAEEAAIAGAVEAAAAAAVLAVVVAVVRAVGDGGPVVAVRDGVEGRRGDSSSNSSGEPPVTDC